MRAPLDHDLYGPGSNLWQRHPGLPRRIVQVAAAGGLLSAWMGLGEALLICLRRDVPEPALFLQQAVLGYAALGLGAGALWGGSVETISPRRGRWQRRWFYLVSLVVGVLAFQLVLHMHLHWTGRAPRARHRAG